MSKYYDVDDVSELDTMTIVELINDLVRELERRAIK